MKLISIGAVFFILSYSAFTQSIQEVAAVLPIKCSGFDNVNLSDVITELTQDAFIKYSNYKIVEKSQVNKILNEQGFQISGITENAVEAGKLLAANKVVVGSLVKLGNELTLSLRLVDIQSGEVLKSEKKSARIEIEDINNVLIDPTVQILVSERPKSIITIFIKSITGLPNMDVLSPSDPWLQVYVGNRLIGRTDFIKDNNSPQFNKRFEITDYSNEIIRIKVFDHDVTNDKSIGDVVLKEPKSGLYPILFESTEGTVENRGQLEVVIEK
ncbi:MAG: CsgG/HfaB family protein [Melioribacter sp.]|nr:CsgG/HfaB family protein [Melioribacter sp.]